MSDPFLLHINDPFGEHPKPRSPIKPKLFPWQLEALKLMAHYPLRVDVSAMEGRQLSMRYNTGRRFGKTLHQRILLSEFETISAHEIAAAMAGVHTISKDAIMALDLETTGGPIFVIDSVAANWKPRVKRKKTPPKKAKGYQPPAWVTRKERCS